MVKRMLIYLALPLPFIFLFFALVPFKGNTIIVDSLRSQIINLFIPLAFLILSIALTIVYFIKRNHKYLKIILLILLFISPLFISGHWVTVPAFMGVGSRGFEYFLEWLTKYPNFGPINYKVALGTLCVLAVHIIPYYFLIVYKFSQKINHWFLWIIFILSLVFYIPVFVVLDCESIIISFMTKYYLILAISPLFRLFAIIAMAIICFNYAKCKKVEDSTQRSIT